MRFYLLGVGGLFYLVFLVQHSEDFYLRGIERSDLNNCQGAIEDFTRAIELYANHDLAFFNRAIEKTHLKNHEGAVKDYTRSIEIKPTSTAYYGRAKSQQILENYEEAIKDYSNAIKLDPNDISSYFDRGILKLRMGDKKSGRADIRKARELRADEICL